MDTFMDKLTGKFGASEVIKANSEAEAKELEAQKAKVSELEKAVSDMRRLSLKAVETNEATAQLVSSAIEKIEEYRAAGVGADSEGLNKISEELANLKAVIEESFKTAQEETHKENVRVYRNVQAAVIEELKQQSEAIALQHLHIEKKVRGIKPCAIVALVFSSLTLVGIIAELVIWYLGLGI